MKMYRIYVVSKTTSFRQVRNIRTVRNISSKQESNLVTKLSSVTSLNDAFTLYNNLEPPTRSNLRIFQTVVKLCRDFGEPKRALTMWSDMKKHKVLPDAIFFTTFLKACRDSGDFVAGIDAFHSLPSSFTPDRGVILSLALLVRDSKITRIIPNILSLSINHSIALDHVIIGSFSVACMESGDVTTANVLLLHLNKKFGEVQVNEVICNQIMQTFRKAKQMQNAVKVLQTFTLHKLSPTVATYRLLLSGCIEQRLLYLGLNIYSKFMNSAARVDVSVFPLLMKLLSQTGRIDEMIALWNESRHKEYTHNVIAWTTLIDGLGDHGRAKDAIESFQKMVGEGIKPDERTFTALLNACSHAGLVAEAKKITKEMENFGISPNIYHRTALIDALGRSGKLEEALDLAEAEKKPSVVMWATILGASRKYWNIKIAEIAVSKIKNIAPESGDLIASQVLLEQIYDYHGHQEDRMHLRNLRKPQIPGITSIEVLENVVKFKAHDNQLDSDDALKKELQNMQLELEKAGHVSDLTFVDTLNSSGVPLTDDEKKWSLCTHSERIAMAYGFIHLPPGEPLFMTKNLRICPNCHEATKILSSLRGREIIMGDANRFHHFKHGKCSCDDYW